MKDRNKKLLEWVRRDLRRRKGIELTDNNELYDEFNRVQTFIIQELKSIEREITVETEIGKETYDFIDESAITVLDFWNNYDIDMKLIEHGWGGYRDRTGADPYLLNISNGKLSLSPIPIRANDVITFKVRQTDVVNRMDEDIEPEIPRELDQVLVLGVCAAYDPEGFKADYFFMLDRIKGNTSTNAMPSHLEGVW